MLLFSKFKIQGHSMTPTITYESEVIVSGIPFLFSEPKIGDIVAFKKENKFFIKRIRKIKNDEYLLIGDNEKDSLNVGWISKINIIGKLLFIL